MSAWGAGQEEGYLKALPPRKKTLSLDLFLNSLTLGAMSQLSPPLEC